MLILVINVVYVLLAIAMIALILMQRGSGAQAGAGFGGGASATVFGSRGASSFLSKSTKWLGITFFAISMGMAWYATHQAAPDGPARADLGLMAETPAVPAGNGNATVPAAPRATTGNTPASTVPAAPAADAPATGGAATPPEQPPAGN